MRPGARRRFAVAATLLLAVVVAAAACGPASKPVSPAVETARSELVLAIAPTGDRGTLAALAQPIAAYLAAQTHARVSVVVPASYPALLDLQAKGGYDVALMPALAYLEARSRGGAGVEPVARTARCAPTFTVNPPGAGCVPVGGSPAIFVCGPDAGVATLRDGEPGGWEALHGLRFRFGGPLDLAGSLLARYYLAHNRVDAAADLRAGVIANPVARTLAVYNSITDCAALQGDERQGALAAAPDVMDKTRVVFEAPELVPGDVVVVRGGMNPGQKAALVRGVLGFGGHLEVAGALQSIDGYTSTVAAADAGFAGLRRILAATDPAAPGEFTGVVKG